MAITDNLVSYWKLDESSGNAADTVGSNTLTNASVTYGAAKINNGATFGSGGGANALTISNASQSGLGFTTGDFTIAMWAKVTDNTQGSFIAKQGTNGYRIRFEAANSIRFLTFEGAGSSLVDFGSAMTTGSWHYLVAERSGTTLGISIDGSAFTTATTTVRNVTNTGIFALGNASPSQNDSIVGMLDEVGIWSRALTGAEVTSLYNSGVGLAYPFGSIVTSGFFNLM